MPDSDEREPATHPPTEDDQHRACRANGRGRPVRLIMEVSLFLSALAQLVPDAYREHVIELALRMLGIQ